MSLGDACSAPPLLQIVIGFPIVPDVINDILIGNQFERELHSFKSLVQILSEVVHRTAAAAKIKVFLPSQVGVPGVTVRFGHQPLSIAWHRRLESNQDARSQSPVPGH